MIINITHSILILAGVRKCGTTTIFDMLARHSRIAPAKAKESQFFACDAETVRKNIPWYLDLFDTSKNPVLLDGSTWYFGASDAPQLIQQNLPNSKIILCLRDPASRAFSGYLHMKKQTPPLERRSFESIVAALEDLVQGGRSLYEAEDLLLDQAVKDSLTDADYINENFHLDRFNAPFRTQLSDRRFSFRYFSESCYSNRLDRWENIFKERLHIIFFEDMMNNPEAVIRDILDFSHLEFEEPVAELIKSNETRLPKGRLSSSILSFRKQSAIGRLAASVLKTAGLSKAGAKFRKRFLYGEKERVSPALITRTRMLLADEYSYWEKRNPHTSNIWRGPRRSASQ